MSRPRIPPPLTINPKPGLHITEGITNKDRYMHVRVESASGASLTLVSTYPLSGSPVEAYSHHQHSIQTTKPILLDWMSQTQADTMEEEDERRGVLEAVDQLSFVAGNDDIPAHRGMAGTVTLKAFGLYDDGYTEREWTLGEGWAPSRWLQSVEYDWGQVQFSVTAGSGSFVELKFGPLEFPPTDLHTVGAIPPNIFMILESEDPLLPTSEPRGTHKYLPSKEQREWLDEHGFLTEGSTWQVRPLLEDAWAP